MKKAPEKMMEKDEEIAARQMKLMEKGFHFGKWKFNRDKLYEREN